MSYSNVEGSIPVVVAGALGAMGSQVIKTIIGASDCHLMGAIDIVEDKQGLDIGLELGLGHQGVTITNDLEGCLCQVSQVTRNSNHAVLIDFTHPEVVYKHTRTAIAYGIHPVIGTTGMTKENLLQLIEFSRKAGVGGALIPNFSIGIILLQQAAAAAARFYDFVELTELHHNLKADAPSGTCIKTAELIEELDKSFNQPKIEEYESLLGCRGGRRESGIRIHSVRLPGLVAHQEVLFGSPGETYTLRHDTVDRSAYMPGLMLVVRKVRRLQSLVYGLERLL
uniref:4-hydroxy-tetrahydrodipicolinate reductase n=1 Tax=Paulinella micropora TaxID=1928728 RepID=A0A385I1B5_9EUKA|nr:dihydrodipicolinate reductase [Paulinella micropora]AXY63716.1 dihydrodipicolinate reductase [Paulinella micropora]